MEDDIGLIFRVSQSPGTVTLTLVAAFYSAREWAEKTLATREVTFTPGEGYTVISSPDPSDPTGVRSDTWYFVPRPIDLLNFENQVKQNAGKAVNLMPALVKNVSWG